MPSEQNAPPTADPFDLLFHNHPLPMWIYDLETLAFLAVNAAAVEQYGYTRDEFLALTIKEIRPPGDLSRLLAHVAQARPALQHAGQWQHRIKDGRVIDVEITSHTLAFNGRQAALVTAQDVTARVRAEASSRKLNRLYALLSDTNQAIVRIRQPQALWTRACRIAVEQGGFRMAWIGLVDETTRKVEVAAHAGVSDGYLEKLAIVLDDEARGRGPTGAALKTGQYVIVNDVAQDPRMDPWREDALRLGYRASAAFPLHVNGQIRGAFNLYAGETDFFDDQEIKLLDELALDLSFALEFAETEEDRVRTEEALAKERNLLHTLIDNIPDFIFVKDAKSRFVLNNAAHMHGLSASSQAELLGKTDFDIFTQELAAQYYADEQAVLQSGQPLVNHEEPYVDKPGNPRWLLTTKIPLHDGSGSAVGLLGISHDITQRKQAEQALRESERSLKEAQIIAGLGSYVLDVLAGRWTSSDVLDDLFGIDETYEHSTAGWAALIHPDDRQPMVDYVTNEVIGARGYFDKEYRIIRHADKAERWVHGLGKLEIDAQNRVLTMHGTIQDITERKQAEEALRESEAELRALFASMQDTVLVIDRAGAYRKIAPTNPAFWYILPQELIGKRLQDVFSAEQSALFSEVLQQVLDTQQTTQIEYELIVGSQSVWYATSISPMDADRTLWVARDITEQKRTQDVLRQRLSELEALHTVSNALRSAQTPEEALPLLLDKTLAALNTDAGAIWLYHAESDDLRVAVESGWFQSLDKPVIKSRESVGGAVFSSGQPHISAEFRSDPQARSSTRGHVPAGWGGACVPIRSGAAIVGVFYVSLPPPRQISPEQLRLLESLAEMAGVTLHRLRLLQESREQVRRVQGIMDTVPTGMLLLDADGRILLVNPVAQRDLAVLSAGVRVGDQIAHLGGCPLADLLVPPPTKGAWHTVQAGTRTFEIIARSMTDASGVFQRVLAINDVTQIREQQRYQQAQERLATVGQMAAGIAHDFNNIMGVITLYAGLLSRSSDLAPNHQRQLNTINDQAQQAASLIRQILDFSRRSVLEKKALDILPLVKEMVKLLQRILPESIRLELVHDRRDYVVNGDPTHLQQVLMNLALNARDAMPDGGQLTFTIATLSLAPDQAPPLPDMAAGEWLCLSVADTGTGIGPEDMTHLFEPFFTTKGPGKGSGLGLAQVYGIIKQHEGSVAVASQAGEGSTFTLYVPLQSTATPVAAQRDVIETLPGGGEGILVVEDNPAIRLSVVETLGELGYQVRSAADGVAALAVLAEADAGSVALLITDLVMPRMGGIELAQTVRQRYPTIKILPMTGHPLDGGGETLRQIGVVDWIQKPFGISDLAAKVRALLDQ